MSTKVYPIVYNRQFERYIGQFMRAISGLQIENGVERNGTKDPRRVPVVWMAMDRVIASLMSKRNDHQVNSKIPMIGVNMSGLAQVQDSRMNPYWNEPIPKRRMETGVPHTAIQRLVGQQFVLTLDVSIYASSTSELFMILEQLLLIFNPRLVIQSDNDAINSDYITSITMDSIQPEITFPLGQGSQECVMNLGFSMPVRMRYPVDNNKAVIDKIVANVMFEGDDRPIFSEVITNE